MARDNFDKIRGVARQALSEREVMQYSIMNPTLGIRTDKSPREIELTATPDMLDTRFEGTAIRKDFGYEPIGSAAPSRVLGLVEHKFIEGGEIFQRIVRVIRTDQGKAQIQVWDGSSWVVVDTSTEDIKDRYMSMVSTQGCLVMAEGSQILIWCEESGTEANDNNFPSGNQIENEGERVCATLDPGEAEPPDYEINYSIKLVGGVKVNTTGTVTLGFYDSDDNKLAERSYSNDKSMDNATKDFPHEEVEVSQPGLTKDDKLCIEIDSIDKEYQELEDSLYPDNQLEWDLPDKFELGGDKSLKGSDDNDLYQWQFDLTIGDDPNDGADIGFYVDRRDGAGFVKEKEVFYDVEGIKSESVRITAIHESDVRWAIAIEKCYGPNPCNIEFVGADAVPLVIWDWANFHPEVHGFNKPDDGDPDPGVEYQAKTGGGESVFETIDDAAPDARYVAAYGDRVIALRDGGDPQSFAWSVDGQIRNWSGEGSGQTFLLDARSDPLDDLQAAVPIGDDVLALLRKRSIMRAYETGNPRLAMGVTHWIEDLGTESPFSVEGVKGGAIFLGHDLMPYLLTPQGTQAVGEPIHEELIETLPKNLNLVDATYDPVWGEYWLGVPENGASRITAQWILDVERLTNNQEISWRRRGIAMQRMATVSKV